MNLNDLPDDVFFEIFSGMDPTQLLGVERVSQQWQRLVRETLERRVKTLVMRKHYLFVNYFSDKCDHLKDTRRTMSLEKMFDFVLQKEQMSSNFMNFNKTLLTSSGRKYFTSCLVKLTGLRCIDFDYQQINVQVLVQAFELCPNLECICIGQRHKLDLDTLNEDDWTNFVNRFGHRLQHISVYKMSNAEKLFLKMARSLSSRNLRLEIIEFFYDDITEDVFTPLNQIQAPNALVKIKFYRIFNEQIVIGDQVDELSILFLLWKAFPDECRRLSYLDLFEHDLNLLEPEQYKPINFSGLKRICVNDDVLLFQALTRCQFPIINQLDLKKSYRRNLNQHLDQLFQKMPTLTKVYIQETSTDNELPGTAFLRLSKLTEIVWRVYIRADWNLQLLITAFDVIEQLSSLEKLAFNYTLSLHWTVDEQNPWREAIEQRLAVLKERRPNLVIRLNVDD